MPQGAFQDKGKSHVRITVFAILAVHVVLLGVLLIAGCNKKTEMTDNAAPVPAPQTTDAWPPPAPGTPSSPTPGAEGVPPVPAPVPTPGAPLVAPGPGTPTADQPVTAPVPTIAPPPEMAPVPAPAGDSGLQTEHTIAKGETLAIIGKKYGVGYKAIEAANPGINPTRLKIGDKIKIPAKTAAAPAASASSVTTGATVYVVRSGDNLLKISKATGVSVKQLRAANNLRTDQIRVGQKLKIPARTAPAPAEAAAPPPVAPPITLPTGQ